MSRKLRTAAAALLAGPAALGLGLAAAGPAAASAAAPAACSVALPIQINGFAFDPAEVTPGHYSTADLISTNCTAGTLATTEEWTGQWLPPVGGVGVVGCPVIDPFIRSVTYAPGQELAENTTYFVPAGCTAAELAVTVRISIPTGASNDIVTATAYLKIIQIAQ